MRRYVTLLICIFAATLGIVQGAAPVITDLNSSPKCGENNVAGDVCYMLTATDPEGSKVSCSLTTITGDPTAANGDEVKYDQDTITGLFQLEIDQGGLDPAVTYTLITECTDAAATQTATVTQTMTVEAGERLRLTNSGQSQDVTVQPNDPAKAGTQLHQMRATQMIGTPNDIKYGIYYIEPSAVSDYFTIDPTSGWITAAKNLKYIDKGTTTSVRVYVNATDGGVNAYGYAIINLIGQNTKPTCIGVNGAALPTNIPVLESAAANTELVQFDVDDPDNNDKHTYKVEYTPSDSIGDKRFIVDSSGRVKVDPDNLLDYETQDRYNVTVYCCDDLHCSNGNSFFVEVTDVNEAPTFSTDLYEVTLIEESTDAVAASPDAIICSDQDIADTSDKLSYSIGDADYSDYVDITSEGLVYFTKTYDLDCGANTCPNELLIPVLCTDDDDKNKLTGSANVKITILDKNDNPPTQTSCAFNANNLMNTGDVIGTVEPTDTDSGTNAELDYCTASTTDGNSANYAFSECKFTLKSKPDFEFGTTVEYEVLMYDKGDPTQTGTATCLVGYVEITTTTVTTTTVATTTAAWSLFGDPLGIAMFVLALLAGLALLGLLTWLCLRFCCGGGNFCGGGGETRCCQSRPERQVTPVREKTYYRERSPPPRIIQQQPQRVQVVRTVARPMMTNMMRPTMMPSYYGGAPPAYFP